MTAAIQEKTRPLTNPERNNAQQVAKLLEKLGRYPSVQKFIATYAKMTTKKAYLYNLGAYLDFLSEVKGIALSPDELILDNLKAVFESKAVDVATKRRHTDWVLEYANVYLLRKGAPEGSRKVAGSIIKTWYQRNDSPLFGDFQVSTSDPVPAAPPLEIQDVRAVLKAMDLPQRLPLLIVLQTSVEVGRVLALTWGDVKGIDRDPPILKWPLLGRKKHKKPYHSYFPRDSMKALKTWRPRWIELQGREPEPLDLVCYGKGGPMSRGHINTSFQETALALHSEGIVKNGNPASWHSHYLRHVWETQAAHAGMLKEKRAFFEGRLEGVQWRYNHVDTVHESDLEEDFAKIVPFVALDYTEATVRDEYEDREKMLLSKVLELERNYEALKKQIMLKTLS